MTLTPKHLIYDVKLALQKIFRLHVKHLHLLLYPTSDDSDAAHRDAAWEQPLHNGRRLSYYTSFFGPPDAEGRYRLRLVSTAPPGESQIDLVQVMVRTLTGYVPTRLLVSFLEMSPRGRQSKVLQLSLFSIGEEEASKRVGKLIVEI